MFESFTNAIRTDIDEFVTTRKMQRAIELSMQTGQYFNHNQYPMYFTGRLDARIVLVHLNPKQANDPAWTYTGEFRQGDFRLDDFASYFTYHQHFGRSNYGPAAPRTHRSPFDRKQIRFLKPFGVIPFVEEQSRDDGFTNLELAIDEKLQLELIPYGSAQFSTKGFTPAILAPHVDRLLDVICACPRDYVFFCGRVFEVFFQDSITHTHEFRLTKKDGGTARNSSRFSNLRFVHDGTVVHAGLAHTFAQQGIRMDAYAQRCKELYDCRCLGGVSRRRP